MAPVFQTLFVVVADINNKGLVIGECKKNQNIPYLGLGTSLFSFLRRMVNFLYIHETSFMRLANKLIHNFKELTKTLLIVSFTSKLVRFEYFSFISCHKRMQFAKSLLTFGF